jgi:uncharacterized protein
MSDLSATAALPPLGTIYLPSGAGTPVGRFEFIVDRELGGGVEIGTPVSADTREGTVVGVVVDMRTVGHAHDPFGVDLLGAADLPAMDRRPEVVCATVQVFASEALRPVRAGVVRGATADELAAATGEARMDWTVAAGVVRLADGSFAKVSLDGANLLGPEGAHLLVGGISGSAKTSFANVLLKSSIAAGAASGHSIGALIFNVKGDDLLWLDQPPAEGYELSDDDLAMYEGLGVPAEPFDRVEVWAPGLPGVGTGTRSSRDDARVLAWDLRAVWPYLRHLLPDLYGDEKVASFLAEFREFKLNASNPRDRIETFGQLDAWFAGVLADAEENDNAQAWRSHHKATMWRLRRMLMGLVSRCGGLITKEAASPRDDLPMGGWSHGDVLVVDIAGLAPDVQALVVARTVERAITAASDGELGVDSLVLFADELNTFAPAVGKEASSVRRVLQTVATQGRYAGLSLWGCAQKLSKIDELVRDNAVTRALATTSDGELASGVYGRLADGLSERIATLPKGSVAVWHPGWRSTMVVRFPRPAWRTGRAKTTGAARRRDAVDTLGLSDRSAKRLTEGLAPEVVETIVAAADDRDAALDALMAARVPDAHEIHLEVPAVEFDPGNPFALD